MAKLIIPPAADHATTTITKMVLMIVAGNGEDKDTVISKIVGAGFSSVDVRTVIDSMVASGEIKETQ